MRKLLRAIAFLVSASVILVVAFFIWNGGGWSTMPVQEAVKPVEKPDTVSKSAARNLTVTKYYPVDPKRDRCDCIYPKRSDDLEFGMVAAPNLDISKCAPYVASAAEFGKITDIKFCDSYLLTAVDGHTLRHTTVHYGEPHEIYDQATFLFDERSSKTIQRFERDSYDLESYRFRETNYDWNWILKLVTERWVREKMSPSSGAPFDESRDTIRTFCRHYAADFKIYLAKIADHYQWGIDLPTAAECSAKVWSARSGQPVVYGVDISGWVVESDTDNHRGNNLQLTYLDFDEHPNEDRSVDIESTSKILHDGKFKLVPKFFNPRDPESDEGQVEVERLDKHDFSFIRDFPYYSANRWVETQNSLWWVSRATGIWRYDFDRVAADKIVDQDAGRFAVSPDERMLIFDSRIGVQVLEIGSAHRRTIGSSGARFAWFTDDKFVVNDEPATTMKELQRKTKACNLNLKRALANESGSKNFSFSVRSMTAPDEQDEMFNGLKLEKLASSPLEFDLKLHLKNGASANRISEILKSCPIKGTVKP